MMLSVHDLRVRYGHAEVLQGVSFDLGARPLAVIGRNGMGKTTLCSTIMGMLASSGGEIRLAGERIDGLGARRIARMGISIVPQGRRVFPSLNVDEHLRLVANGRKGVWTTTRVFETFPALAARRSNGGSQLSGGEQQMLAIARALLMNPRLIIMDEPSEGLAPVVVEQLADVLSGLAADGIGLLLVEQNLSLATSVASHVAVIVAGRIAAKLPSAELMADEELQHRFLGVSTSAMIHHPALYPSGEHP